MSKLDLMVARVFLDIRSVVGLKPWSLVELGLSLSILASNQSYLLSWFDLPHYRFSLPLGIVELPF